MYIDVHFWQIIPTILSHAVVLFIYAWKVQDIMAFMTFLLCFVGIHARKLRLPKLDSNLRPLEC